MPFVENKLFLVIDIGTSYIKGGCVNSENSIIAWCQREFPIIQNDSFIEVDFDLFLSSTKGLLKECLNDPGVKDPKVTALLITSQAQTFVPVDADFQPLQNGIVWLDSRAGKEAEILKEELPEFNKTAGFVHPLAEQYISKLLWLKEHEPTVFKKAHAFPLINEYLAQKLTGRFYSESTGFGMSGMYDFRSNMINKEALTILGLNERHFPKIEKAAGLSDLISNHIQEAWDLPNRFPVYLCGNDQGASACGAGVKKIGDVSINFGTAMVFYTVTELLVTDLSENQIAGKHPVGDEFFLLNLENDFGIQIRRLKDEYFKNSTYDLLFQTYLDYPGEFEKTLPSGDSNLKFVETMESHQFCAGVIKYYLNRFKIHYDQICKTIDVKNIYISGGMTQSSIFLDILNSTLNRPFTLNNRANAGIFGAIEIYKNNH